MAETLQLLLVDRPAPAPGAPTFARHETFHPRHGWIKKGFDAAASDPSIFHRENAPTVLGVGKNMVRAIRYWCHAFKVLEAKSASSVPTDFGQRLLGPQGWDPYLEDTGSLWLLHEQLLVEPSLATAWEYAFLFAVRPEFTADDLARGLEEFVSRSHPAARVAPSSFRKDVTCFIRMYAPGKTPRAFSEESIRCPFVDLELLGEGITPGSFAFTFGEKPGLSPEIVASAALRFAARTAPGARTVALTRLMRERGGPAAVFKLTESALYAALEEAAARYPQLDLSEAGGIVQLAFEDPEAAATQLLQAHYSAAGLHA